MRVLVVGATGLLGSAVCAQARRAGHDVRALVRAGSPRAARLLAEGCELAVGDLKDGATCEAACRGCDAVIVTANTMASRGRGDTLETVDRRGTLDLVAAVRRTAVGHIVYTSISPEMPADVPFVAIKREVEAAVRASGVRWTILQPAAFMEVHAGPIAGWDFARGRARITGGGNTVIAYISIADVAAFAVAALTHPAATNRDLVLRGPEPLTARQAVDVASRVTGRLFSVQRAPLPVLRLVRAVIGPFSEHLGSLLGLMIGQERVALPSPTAAPYEQFNVRPTTFAEYVAMAGAPRDGPDILP